MSNNFEPNIPKATVDGHGEGFNPNQPLPVIVDPDSSGTGRVLLPQYTAPRGLPSETESIARVAAPQEASPVLQTATPVISSTGFSPERLFGISFLSEAPQKPTVEVQFILGLLGTLATRYHAVIVEGSCMVLVYDTRFDYGVQFEPPVLNDTPITIKLNSKTSYTCNSLGLQFKLGCLQCVVLLTSESEAGA